MSFINSVAEGLVNRLPPALQPYAKAVVPFLVTILVAVAAGVASGTWDKATIGTAVGGILAALITFAVPNKGGDDPDSVPDDELVQEKPLAVGDDQVAKGA